MDVTEYRKGKTLLARLYGSAPLGTFTSFKQMKVTQLDGLAVSLALEEKFQGNKQTKQGLLLPHVQSWYGDQPQTRTSTTDK